VSKNGRLAQLVERLLYTQDVGGSNPSPPTSAISIDDWAGLAIDGKKASV
jgi:hypothetical protein